MGLEVEADEIEQAEDAGLGNAQRPAHHRIGLLHREALVHREDRRACIQKAPMRLAMKPGVSLAQTTRLAQAQIGELGQSADRRAALSRGGRHDLQQAHDSAAG